MTVKLSKAAKQARGTHRPDRDVTPSALDRLRDPPPAPDTLSERACVEWAWLSRQTCELGVLTTSDLRALALLSESLAMEAELREILHKEGLVIDGANSTKGHPALRALESTRAQAMKLLDAFGLTPRSRLSVDMAPTRPSSIFGNNGKRLLDRYVTPPKPWET